MRAKVNVVVGRGSNGIYCLRVEDAVSGLRVVEIDLTGEQLAAAVTGLYTSDVMADLFPEGVSHWGRDRYEYATFYRHAGDWAETQRALGVELSADGWTLVPDGRPNPHRWGAGRMSGHYGFRAGRWVPVDAG